jgi:hypothetical protein
MWAIMRIALLTAVVCLAGCSVYETPAASASDDAGNGGRGGDPVTSAGSSGPGGTPDTAGGTVVGSAGAVEDAGTIEEQVIGDTSDAALDSAPEAPSIVMTCAGYALQFSGISYVRVNRPVQDDFTLEAWIKSNTPSLTGTHHWEGSALLWADASGNHDDYGGSVLNNKLAFGVGNPGGLEPTIVSSSLVINGKWNHVAMTRTKSTGEIQVFVNGVKEASLVVATETKSLNAQVSMLFGGNVFDMRYYVGLIDEVRAWSVVRSEADIAGTMNKKLMGSEPGLVGYWRFDEGSGTSTADVTATKNNGDLFGSPNWVVSDAPICP